MHEQELKAQQPEGQQEGRPLPRRAWERPTLQRLHVSLDTANEPGSGGDAGSATGPL
jgi:hypothetical protein